MDDDDNEVDKSEFNEAKLKMSRIHELQHIINICSINKLGQFYQEGLLGFVGTGQRNYEVIFQSINQLYQEVYPKCNSKETGDTSFRRNVLIEFMRTKKPFTSVPKINGSTENVFNEGNWVVLEKELIEYESIIRKLLETHQLAGRHTDDDGL